MIVESVVRRVRRAFGLVALATFVLVGTGPAPAQDYPRRPVTLVVPFAAGGTTDSLGRLFAHYLGATLGQPVVIDNRPGAGSVVGAAAVAKSAPDGYTLLLGAISTHAIAIALYDKVNYDSEKDFIPIAHVASVPNVLVVSPKRIKATTVQDFVDEAKKASTKLNFASSGAGTSIHLSGEMFKIGAKIDMVHVPYRGAGPALNDMIAGNVDLMFDNLPSCLPAHPGRTAASAGGHLEQETRNPAGGSYDRRDGHSGIRSRLVVRRVRAGRYARQRGQSPEGGDRAGDRESGVQGPHPGARGDASADGRCRASSSSSTTSARSGPRWCASRERRHSELASSRLRC